MLSEFCFDGYLVQGDYRLNPCCSGRCSRRQNLFLASFLKPKVLILVVVEDALGATSLGAEESSDIVLILVVVEDALGENQSKRIMNYFDVLILVVVEDALGGLYHKKSPNMI